MKIKINAEVRNGALRGNTMSKVIEIDDEDLEGYDEAGRDRIIRAEVEERVLAEMVGWDWEIVDD